LSTQVNAQRVPLDKQLHASKSTSYEPPATCYAIHDVGRILLSVNNNGTIGRCGAGSYACFEPVRVFYSCQFPSKMYVDYLSYASLWVGAVVGSDTLVSTSYPPSLWSATCEMWPDPPPDGEMQYRSTVTGDESVREGAVSEQDYIAVYTDTLRRETTDYFHWRIHKPLYVEITQRSYAWSYGYAEDLVLFDMTLKNVGDKRLEDLYIGLEVDVDARLGLICSGVGFYDDICGFMTSAPSIQGCGFEDSIGIAWSADADGDPYEGEYHDTLIREAVACFKSARSVTGISILDPSPDEMRFSYNWVAWGYWLPYDFGPRPKGPYRNFKTDGSDWPYGDVNKYFIMSNGEKDYDLSQIGAIENWDPYWMYPGDSIIRAICRGAGLGYVLSFGPYRIFPGEETNFTFAFIGGEDFHTNPLNVWNLPDDWKTYYANVDFSDLTKNATWAKWIYDNPGFDTDGDGYLGKFRVCVHDSIETDTGWIAASADSFWYEGDGVPDYRGAMPPAAPYFWVTPLVNGFHIRFNGCRSETERDVFSNIVDFEGYNIWLGRDDRESSYSLVASYDINNYDKWIWNKKLEPRNYELRDNPFTLEQLRCLYGQGADPCSDITFRPYAFTRGNPYIHPDFTDSMFYFLPHHYNASELGVTSPITKMYPDEPNPATLPLDSLTPDHYTAEGFPKYYEYEFTITNLLSTVPYWVNVTAFDFGSAAAGLNPLETSKTVDAQTAYVYSTEAQAAGQERKIYIYPNPYRKDANYREHGFEGRTADIMPNEKVRAINFTNLPAKCTIRIHTVDGDLVRTIHHDFAPDDPWAHHDEWNMVTRNRNAVMSGLYYWTVEDEFGNVQMGKLVIIM